jgi:YidC/Oxa1 family membrane protein insertase
LDKKTILLVVLLGVLVIFWMPIMTKLGIIKPPEPKSEPTTEQTEQQPSTTTTTPETTATAPSQNTDEMAADTTSQPSMTETPDTASRAPEDTIIIETKLMTVVMSNYGGAPISILLKKYKYQDGNQIEMLPDCQESTPRFLFNGGKVDINKYVYATQTKGTNTLNSGSQEISYIYQKPDGSSITKRYRFYADKYDYDLVLEVSNRADFDFEREYSLQWNNKLDPTELNIQDDYNSMWVMAKMGSETAKFDDYSNNQFNTTMTGETFWTATRSKYFTAIMVPLSRPGAGAGATGVKHKITTPSGSVTTRALTTSLQMDIPFEESLSDSFAVYVGPMDYELLDHFHEGIAHPLVDIGTTPVVGWLIWIFARPIIWLLPKMYSVIPNYGLVIIIFSILVKLITWPLSRKSVQSMNAMREIQPELAKLKEKHKKNPQALNREMMKLYKERGVNPLAGCLPMLPQMPLFFALFAVFRSTILLRQAPFILWWNDLSRGALSMTDPYIILVVLMVVLMFLQQKMTMTDPKNKAMTYMMPLIMGFFFYRASAGLVLYWTCFSLFSFIEQIIFKKPTAPKTAPVVVANK